MGELQLVREYATPIIDDFIMDISESQDTKDTYRRVVGELLYSAFGVTIEYITLSQLRNLSAEDFVNYRRQIKAKGELKNSSINTMISGLKSFYGYLKHKKIINVDMDDINYYRNFDNDSDHYDTIPMGMANEILEYIAKNEKRLVNQKIWYIKLAIETGLRQQDILQLTKSQFTIEEDKERVIIRSNSKNKGKGNQKWVESIHINVYNEMKRDLFTDSEKLFTIHESTLLKCVQKIIAKLGYTGHYVLHSFKRTAIDNTRKYTGGDIKAIQRKAKHASAKTTLDNYMDDIDYGSIGYFSIQHEITTDYIAEATHEELLKAIDGLDKGMILLLQKQLQKMKEGV